MEIGIISDIHGTLPEAAAQALEGCDRIICAGDMGSVQTLWELEAIAPTIAVRGNNDYGDQWGPTVHFSASPKLAGVRFFVVHRPNDIGIPADDVQVVIHGHTHVPRDEQINGIRYVNPGSVRYPRRNSRPSVARMAVEDGQVRSLRFIELPVR
ncbi:MAG: metallophosphoesterase family protein [Eggerthellaceae bacterium]